MDTARRRGRMVDLTPITVRLDDETLTELRVLAVRHGVTDEAAIQLILYLFFTTGGPAAAEHYFDALARDLPETRRRD